MRIPFSAGTACAVSDAKTKCFTGTGTGEVLLNADDAMIPLRLCKDADEIADLRRAIEISETALAEVIHETQTGETETSILARLKSSMLSHGATGFAFEPIVLTTKLARHIWTPH